MENYKLKLKNRKFILTVCVVILIFAFFIFHLIRNSSDGQEVSPSTETLSGGLAYAGWEGYAHPDLPFAFAYPNDLVPSTFQDGEAEIVLLEGESGREVQIIVRAFDEPGPLTVERIQRDLPEMVIEEPQNALIMDKKISALLFWSGGASLGRTREVWFTQGGYLYQVTAPAQMDETLARMMETWRFE